MLKTFLTGKMHEFAKNLEFEKADNYLHRVNQIKLLEDKLEPIRVRKYNKIAFGIKKVLGLSQLPLIIEAFDNSHNQGDCNVAASVRFVNNKPEKISIVSTSSVMERTKVTTVRPSKRWFIDVLRDSWMKRVNYLTLLLSMEERVN